MRNVKIVCTLGPSTEGIDKLSEIIDMGMDVARLNFSHGDHDTHRKMYDDVRKASKIKCKPIAVLGDLCGPKIRVGRMKDGGVTLKKGEKIILTNEKTEGTSDRISHSYEPLHKDVKPGDPIYFDDGLLSVVVDAINGTEVTCTIETGGILKDRKGMNLPKSNLSTKAVTDKDREDIVFGRELGVDYFALSFVRTAQDVLEAKKLTGDIPVIAKIEKPEAVENLDEIMEVSDGIMVARGDLGVELGHEKVPLVQKRIINEMRLRAKPVITATQMLDSMIENPKPTRAEVSDVANAILDGTDAIMLSGETSAGKYPIEAVRTFGCIIDEVENSTFFTSSNDKKPVIQDSTFSNYIADAAGEIARNVDLSAIATYTESGYSAILVSSYRPKADIIAFSQHEKVLNRLALIWGIKPLHGEWVKGVKGVVEQAERKLIENGLVESGDRIAITFGMIIDNEPFQTNILKLWTVR